MNLVLFDLYANGSNCCSCSIVTYIEITYLSTHIRNQEGIINSLKSFTDIFNMQKVRNIQI